MTDSQQKHKNGHVLEAVYRQVDGIFALEGFHPTETSMQVRAAVAAGKITAAEFRQEYLSYIAEHKSPKGFIESRKWRVRDNE